jgi:hypothetical protein
MNTNNGLIPTVARAVCFIALGAIFNAAWAWTPSVVFENHLGNANQVLHSVFGPNGVITQGDPSITYDRVRYGKGMRVDGDTNASSVTKVVFPTNMLKGLGNQGTLSFWIRPGHDSNYNGIARWISADDPDNASGFQPYIYWRGWDQEILFGACTKDYGCGPYPPSSQVSIAVTNTAFAFKVGDPFHVAIVWHRSGIAGTTDTLRAYINGKLMGATSPIWSADLTLVPIQIGAADYAQLATIDELTINRAAITDWSLLPVK